MDCTCIIIRKRLTYFLEVFKDYDRNIVFETRSRVTRRRWIYWFSLPETNKNRTINYQSLGKS